jgi:hypothetical protein
MSQDEKYLNLLSLFHYVIAGLSALVACFPIFHLIAGIAMIVMGLQPNADYRGPPPALFGGFFVAIAGTMMALGWAFAIAIAVAGWFLGRRKHRTFCLVVAGIECMAMPYGTVLGILTLIVLMRPSVEELFASGIDNKDGSQPHHKGETT